MVRSFLSVVGLLVLGLTPLQLRAQVDDLPGLDRCGDPEATLFALIFVEEECFDISEGLTRDGKLWLLSIDDLEIGTTAVIGSLEAVLNPDPFITFGMSTHNLAAGPITYALFLGLPIVPDFYTSALSTAGVSVTTGAEGAVTVDNSAIYPTYVSGYGTSGAAMTNLGVDLGTDPCTASSPGVPGGDTETCDYGTATNTFPPTFYDNLEALLTYEQTGASSVASWSGSVVLEQAAVVPEPSILILLSTGLIGVAGVAVGRRRRG